MNLFITWLLYSLSIIFIAWLLPGISVDSLVSAFLTAILLGLINAFIKPVLILVTLPVNFLTLGLFTLFINAFLLWFTGKVAPGFEVDGFWSAFFGAIILSLLSGFFANIKSSEK